MNNRIARLNFSAALLAALTLMSGTSVAGSLSGRLTYPSEFIPPMTVIAKDVTTDKIWSTDTPNKQAHYQIKLPAGSYIVYAIPREGQSKRGEKTPRGAHTTYSLCARDTTKAAAGNCKTGALIKVQITDSVASNNIDIDDWYLPDALQASLIDSKNAALPAKAAEPQATSPTKPSGVTASKPISAIRFSDYPVAAPAAFKPRHPDFRLAPAGASAYKRQIKLGARAGAVFAGRVAITTWGCGTRCENWAMVDLSSGHIVWPEAPFQPLQYNLPCEAKLLEYRLDSRMLSLHRLEGDRVITQNFLWSNDAHRLERLNEKATPVELFCRDHS